MFNTSFRKYVDEYCATSECTVDEALKSDAIKQMFRRYTEV